MNRNERLGMRVKAEDKKQWQAAAEAEGMSLSAWIEKVLNSMVVSK